jgi:hypothetical protein
MARPRIELGTPRFSVVIRPEKAGHDRRRPGKKFLQIDRNCVAGDLPALPGYCATVDLW